MPSSASNWERVYRMSFRSIYPHYRAKVERKGRSKAELDQVIRWLTGYTQRQLEGAIADGTDMRTFFIEAPALNPARAQVTGTICGERVEAIADPLKRDIRILDKLVDELAKGRTMANVLRGVPGDTGYRHRFSGSGTKPDSSTP